MTETRSRQEYQARIEQVVTYISTHLNEPLNLETLAGISHFSPYHFHRIFTNEIGETPQDLVNRLRLEYAANLLLKSTFSITEIAFRCGFSSSATFARSFKQHFGISAGEYARRGVAALPAAGERLMPPDFTLPEVRMQMIPRTHLAYIADMKGYSLPVICRAWERLYRWAGAHDLLNVSTRMIGISFDDPLITASDKCRYFACITVPDTVSADGRIGVLDIPECRCAVCQALVPAEQIQLVYRGLYHDWLPDSGLQPTSFPSFEVYIETPETNAQGLYRMDVCLPVMPL